MRSLFRVLFLGAVAASAMISPADAFSASFSWTGIGFCGSTSPAVAIRSAPKGTASLRFAMMDIDAPNFRHGGSTVAYDGKGRVAQGAVSYVGPCPPPGAAHRYTWTIEALDAGGRVLGTTRASGSFPPK
jgi:phosphatidylethanolamine-binding protein (PEBP) family uncharacterized protein